jgi:hypothetical protein
MIGVCVGEHRVFDDAPGIDVDARARAREACLIESEERFA